MKYFWSLIITLTVSGLMYAQDPSKALLDRLSQKVLSHQNIQIAFDYVLDNKDAGVQQKTTGKLTLKGKNYRFEMMGAIQIFDGKKVYTIVDENEEVTVEPPQKSDASELSPQDLIQFYKQGYTYKWDIEQAVGNRKIQYIKLTPIATKSSLQSILLGIDSKNLEIYKVIQTGKNGTKTTLTVQSWKVNQTLPANALLFDKAYYTKKGYYISEL
ncbi:MAG: outer membrane lipoprotein carrier protein LolA [Flavobacteriaceae bacterium]|jgi:outer membrane lipoprotein-sorting protein|nr:outer membrane lipoprotein carrier protein LolA [Flavobacteriaceae bacterium]MDP4673742.1 outer membrane lipoprotein carrier protein LolA [Flavobacteriaceae bacterium]MDP4754527.1 outer membrane lipoprotein carrier protein LolA [Flavobacteriaceae bacterium]MDP4794727.1 outer membrane lipoprotein carrier protein LolA [Flavobacteriaceae bacterium]MDP4885564.1 outer membrane lipoprotein carrier protein LolA [Flavobacteriaceae bacterium]